VRLPCAVAALHCAARAAPQPWITASRSSVELEQHPRRIRRGRRALSGRSSASDLPAAGGATLSRRCGPGRRRAAGVGALPPARLPAQDGFEAWTVIVSAPPAILAGPSPAAWLGGLSSSSVELDPAVRKDAAFGPWLGTALGIGRGGTGTARTRRRRARSPGHQG
jgi:hypothetical protein